MQSRVTTNHSFSHSFSHLDQHLVTFLLFTFFVQSADKIISYITPGLIENIYNNSFITGSIISLSSLAGLASDWILPRFIRSTSVIALLRLFFLFIISTIIFLFAGNFVGVLFIPAMIVWGIYYDILRFSDYKIINKITSKIHFVTYWSAHATIKSLTTIVAPLVAILLLDSFSERGLLIASVCVILGYIQFFQLKKYAKLHSVEHAPKHKIDRKQMIHLIKSIWPLYLFACALYILDASFWTIGILLADTLGKINFVGNFILPAFTIPGLFVLLLIEHLSLKRGKKKTMFMSGITGASILVVGFFSSSILFLVTTIFLSSIFFSVCWPLLYTVFEEYILRATEKTNELIAIEDSASNVGYIVGPFISGLLVALGDYQSAFQIIGLTIIITGGLGLHLMKQKVRFT